MGSTFIFSTYGGFGMSVVKRVPKKFNGETYSSLVHSTLKLFKAGFVFDSLAVRLLLIK